jgi:hypothetical protein
MDRLDIPLPYGNTLVFLKDDGRLFVCLVMIVKDRRTCVTPELPIEACAIRDLLSVPYAEFDLGPIRLSAEPRCLIVHHGFHHIPVDHEVWKPMVREWLQSMSSTT